jgi:GMP synthase (glutamine-hydrolysing)
MKRRENIFIIDFGSQYTQLIARRVREANVFCEIVSNRLDAGSLAARKPSGIILSGGPDSVYQEAALSLEIEVLKLGVPILGICYGMQLMAHLLEGKVEKGDCREYGRTLMRIAKQDDLYQGLDEDQLVWMSHGDRITSLPEGFQVTGCSESNPIVSMSDENQKLYGIQFHPEVIHTKHGMEIIKNFLYRICQCRGDWTMAKFLEESVQEIKGQVGSDKVICALSGGVDSSVMALLVHKAIGANLICLFIDNGLLRKGEPDEVIHRFERKYHLNVSHVDASQEFLDALKGVSEPEQKRKIIGNTFIQVFEHEAKRRGNVKFLAQGTIYPDRIESASVKGPSATIKTHHNVGGLPQRMNLTLIEPLKNLFKDEVRKLGLELGLYSEFLKRHPFPGPGLAVRIVGDVTPERIQILQEADFIFLEELKKSGFYEKVSQAFVVLLPVKSVGVMGDERTYENVLTLRAVETTDFMTADWSRLPHDFLALVSTRIVNEVRGINRVLYDISSKPPSTIEWE